MNNYFVFNHVKNWARIRLVVFEKNAKISHFNSEKNDVNEPKARLLTTLMTSLQVKGQFLTFGNHFKQMIFESLAPTFNSKNLLTV